MKQKDKIAKYWKDKGYFVINLIRITPIGLPDYIALKPNEVIFIESKETWDRLSELQKIRLEMLNKIGFTCYVNFDKYIK
jgi:Holliday junction resolvase